MRHLGGSLLARAGLISWADLEAAQELRREFGGTVPEALVDLGAIDEDRLADFFRQRLLVPHVAAEQLQRISSRTLRLVPADMALEFRVIPVDTDAEGTLTLAMADPSDAAISDEVSFFTGRFCQRAVASVSGLRNAIETHYGVAIRRPSTLPPRPARRDPLLSFAAPDRAGEAAAPSDPTPLPLQRVVAPVPLDQPVAIGLPAPETPAWLASIRHPVELLRQAETREEIAGALLGHVAQMAARALLFVTRGGRLEGYDGRGARLSMAVLQRLSIPLDRPSMFRDTLDSRLPFLSPGAACRTEVFEALGELRGDVLLIPVFVRDRAIALLYADGITGSLPRTDLVLLAREAGAAYERLILDRKQRAAQIPRPGR